jgi:hypothetical protein
MQRKASGEATLSRDPVNAEESERGSNAQQGSSLSRSILTICCCTARSRCQAESFLLFRPAAPRILPGFPAAGNLRTSPNPSLHILAVGGRKETGDGSGYVFGCEILVELQG